MLLDTAIYNGAKLSLVHYNEQAYDIAIVTRAPDGHLGALFMRIGEDELVNWEDMARARLDRYLARTGGAQKPIAGHQV